MARIHLNRELRAARQDEVTTSLLRDLYTYFAASRHDPSMVFRSVTGSER